MLAIGYDFEELVSLLLGAGANVNLIGRSYEATHRVFTCKKVAYSNVGTVY